MSYNREKSRKFATYHRMQRRFQRLRLFLCPIVTYLILGANISQKCVIKKFYPKKVSDINNI
jgi:hypothetical protein